MKKREYKVVQVKKRGFFSGPLDATKLEKILNEHATEGWIFDKALDSETLFLEKDTFLLIFYKEA